MINLDPNDLMYIKRGVLYVEKKPYYIVDLIKEQGMSYVMVYRVHPGTDDNPKKLAQELSVKEQVFSNNTRLGQLANAIIPSKVAKTWVVKEPVFMAPVLPVGLNTFTGQEESGFYEREEDKMTVQGGEKRMVRGKNTGVFIGLSSIVWEEKIHIPTSSLLQSLTNYQQQQDIFYDLQGNNSDKHNPLSSYYKEQ